MSRARSPRYAVALLACLCALALKIALGPTLAPAAYLTFYAAVFASAWYGGRGPGLAATALSTVIGGYCFLTWSTPAGSLDVVSLVRAGMFAAVASGLSVLLAAFNGARQRADVADERYRVLVDQLERRIAERTAELSRTNEELRRSEERFALAVAGANDGLWDWDLGEDRFYVSPRMRAILGFDAARSTQRIEAFLQRVYPQDLERLVAHLVDHIEGRSPHYEVEYRWRKPDGNYCWLLSRGLVARTSNGTPHRMAGSMADITDRKREDEALRVSEAGYRALVEKITDGIFVVDNKGLLSYISPAIEVVSGYRAAEVTGQVFTTFVHPEDRAAAWDSFLQTTTAGPATVELRVVTKAGEVRFVRSIGRPVLQPDGAVGMRTFLMDITESKRVAEAVAKSEERFRTVIENISDMVGLVDAEGRLSFVGPSVTRILGYSTDELVGVDAVQATHPEDRDSVLQLFHDLLLSPGTTATLEYRCRHKDGSTRWLETVATNLLTAPDIGAIVFNSRDITERKRGEESLREKTAELAHVLRVNTMGEMASGLAHELNQPLQALVMFARGCVRRLQAGQGASELSEPLEQIAQEALRAGEIVRRMRRLVRKDEPKLEWVDLNEVVAEAARLLEPEALRNGIAMRLDAAAAIPKIEADTVQIEQVILNLMRNGLEALAVRSGGERILSVATSMPRADTVQLTVRDTGEGFASDLAEQVFVPFFTTKANGLGMGLSISRSIIEAHGGRMWAASTPGQGATFGFSMRVDGRTNGRTNGRPRGI